jgi:hypothetical protein
VTDVPQKLTLEPTTVVRLDDLIPHPKNYLAHPEDQVDEIIKSIKAHGLYRTPVVSIDGYILAGHGVTLAMMKIGYEYAEVIMKPYTYDSPEAMTLLIGDNELGRMAVVDDRVLTENLKTIKQATNDLGGTGYDDLKLAARVFVTRTKEEMQDRGAAASWSGMPEYHESSAQLKVTVLFPSEDYRTQFGEKLGIDMSKVGRENIAAVIWWPFRVMNDLKNVSFEPKAENPAENPGAPEPEIEKSALDAPAVLDESGGTVIPMNRNDESDLGGLD